MNKHPVSIICVALLVIVVACFLAWYTSTSPHRTLIASGHPNWPPIMFQSGETISGVGPDVVQKIFDQLGITTAFPYEGAWDQVQGKAATGEIDVLVAAYKTTAREQYMAYSDPYTTDPIVLFVPADQTFTFTKWSDLIGKKGVATTGNSYGQDFDSYSTVNLTLDRVPDSLTAFAAITEHKADYYIDSLYAGDNDIKKNNLTGIVSLPQPVAEKNFYITISKRSPFLKYLPDINRWISKYKADGTIDTLVDR